MWKIFLEDKTLQIDWNNTPTASERRVYIKRRLLLCGIILRCEVKLSVQSYVRTDLILKTAGFPPKLETLQKQNILSTYYCLVFFHCYFHRVEGVKINQMIVLRSVPPIDLQLLSDLKSGGWRKHPITSLIQNLPRHPHIGCKSRRDYTLSSRGLI